MWSNVGADSASDRLLKAARAAQYAEDFPRESAKSLVSLCRAVRLYYEARDYRLTRAKLQAVRALTTTHDDEALRQVFEAHVVECEKYLSVGGEA